MHSRSLVRRARTANAGIFALVLALAGAYPAVLTTPASAESPPTDSAGPAALPGERTALEISGDSGGLVAEFAVQMYQLKAQKREVRFVGRCDSACTLLLALPKTQTCVTSNAYFRFHAPSAPNDMAARAVQDFMIRKYPKWVQAWIARQGGLTSRLITMNYDYANRHMRTCT